MDILLIICLFEFLCMYLYFVYAEVYFFLSIIIFLVYFITKYYDNDHTTGFRSWPWLRNYTLFGKSVRYYTGDPKAFESDTNRMLFVVIGNQSNLGLIHGFCMHGGKFKNLDLVVMLPAILFKIPLLRDVLLWMGGVSDECDTLRLLQKGKSVVYCPTRMDNFTDFGEVKFPETSIFEFAMQNKISIVPVFVTAEPKRYVFLRIRRVQKWFYDRIGWPFPFFLYPRSGGPLLDVQLGSVMDGSLQKDPEAFLTLFMDQFCEDLKRDAVMKV